MSRWLTQVKPRLKYTSLTSIHPFIHVSSVSLSLTHTSIYMHGHTHTYTHTHFKTTYTEHFHLEAFQVTELICLKTEDMFSLSLQCASSQFSQMSEWCFLHHVTQGKNKGTVPFIPSPSLSLSLFNCTSIVPVLLVLSSLCQVFSSINVSFFKVFNALSPLLTFQTIFFYNVRGHKSNHVIFLLKVHHSLPTFTYQANAQTEVMKRTRRLFMN